MRLIIGIRGENADAVKIVADEFHEFPAERVQEVGEFHLAAAIRGRARYAKGRERCEKRDGMKS